MRNNHRTIMRTVVFTSLLVVGLAGYAMAQTPDGVTPAVETECDGLTGVVFGLCNAYCEAQDCDVQEPERKSCERLRDNFERKTGSRFFPCDPLICEDLSGSMCLEGTCPGPEENCRSVTREFCPNTGAPCGGKGDPACLLLCVTEFVCECGPPLIPCDEANRCSEGGQRPHFAPGTEE